MPYIDEKTINEDKNVCGDLFDTLDIRTYDMINFIREFPEEDREGICNYVISRVVAGSMRPAEGWRYKYLARAYGVFMAAGAEFYRRLLSPYEDKCIEKNGDIDEYKNKT